MAMLEGIAKARIEMCMRRSRLLAFAFFLALSALATARADEVDGYVAAFIHEHNIPGLSLAVVRDGKSIKASGYGLANLELSAPATADTAYEIGSITKHFTAQAIMLLAEEGKLGLDDTLGQHLDGLPQSWQALTLRQLLTHTSGLKDWEAASLLSFRREYTPAEFIALMAPFALDFTPGERWSYSNSGYVLLGMVITRASGMSYDEFVAQRIFKPLGMSATRFSRPLEIVPHRASGYVDEDGHLRKGEPLRPRLVEPNGGILTSVVELAKWERALASDALLARASRDAMTTPVRLSNGDTFKAGFGIFVDRFRGHPLYVHNGTTPGGFSSVFYRYPDDKLTVFVLCNIDRGDAVNRIATRVASFYVAGLDIRSLPERADPDPRTSRALLEMLGDLAHQRATDLPLPEYRMSESTRTKVTAQLASLTRFAFLDREEQTPDSPVARILRYKLISDKQLYYYTFELTAAGKVADLFVEQ